METEGKKQMVNMTFLRLKNFGAKDKSTHFGENYVQLKEGLRSVVELTSLIIMAKKIVIRMMVQQSQGS